MVDRTLPRPAEDRPSGVGVAHLPDRNGAGKSTVARAIAESAGSAGQGPASASAHPRVPERSGTTLLLDGILAACQVTSAVWGWLSYVLSRSTAGTCAVAELFLVGLFDLENTYSGCKC